MSARPTYVLAFRGPGENNFPAVLPSGTVIVDYQHDDRGGTCYLYDFANADDAANFAVLVGGQVFTRKGEATQAFEEATSA